MCEREDKPYQEGFETRKGVPDLSDDAFMVRDTLPNLSDDAFMVRDTLPTLSDYEFEYPGVGASLNDQSVVVRQAPNADGFPERYLIFWDAGKDKSGVRNLVLLKVEEDLDTAMALAKRLAERQGISVAGFRRY